MASRDITMIYNLAIVSRIGKLHPISTRNARVTLATSFMLDLLFILPIWLLFGTDQLGLSVTMTTVLFMTIWLGSGLLELPTGALADRLGRRRMFLVGIALLASYPIVYVVKAPVPVILAVSMIAAFGSALRSGTLIPLTHDAYKKEGRSDQDYHAFLSNEKILTFIARAVSGVAGGFLYAFDPRAPYAAMFVLYIVVFITGFFVIDVAARSSLSQTKHLKQAMRSIARHRLVLVAIGCYCAVNLVAEAIWTAFQPFLSADMLSVQLIGVIFSVIALVSALGAYCVRFIMRRVGVLRLWVCIAGIVALTTALMATPYAWLHVGSVLPIAFAFGMTMIPFTATVQKYLDGKFHSTGLSVLGLLQYGIYGVASLYVSVLIDIVGTTRTRQTLCVAALVALIFVACMYVRYRHLDVVLSAKADEAETEGVPIGAQT